MNLCQATVTAFCGACADASGGNGDSAFCCSDVGKAGGSPRNARLASLSEKLLTGQLRHVVSFNAWHLWALYDDLMSFAHALFRSSSPNGNPSTASDFRISQRTLKFGGVQVTQTVPAPACEVTTKDPATSAIRCFRQTYPAGWNIWSSPSSGFEIQRDVRRQ